MGCYYCKLANIDSPEVGVCKECSVVACPPSVQAHGDKCSKCGIFYCYQHHKTHATSHGLNVFQAFPNNANRVASMVINWLQEVTPERAFVMTDLGKFLSDWLEDESLEKDFNKFEQLIRSPQLFKLDVNQFSMNLLNRLLSKLTSIGVEIK